MKTKLREYTPYIRAAFFALYLLLSYKSGARASDQNIKSIEDMHVSVRLNEGNLEEAFVQLSDQTGLNFKYEHHTIDGRHIETRQTETSLGSYLRIIAREAHLKFHRINETIHVEGAEYGEGSVQESPVQDILVTGRVLAEDSKEGLPGVNVIVKGTTTGAITDIDGNYRISIPSRDAVLQFSFIGYVPIEVSVGSQQVIDVTMKLDVTSLDEIVIVGYGEQKKETVVGAVTQTEAEVLERTAGIPNVSSALTGNLPGLITTASTGMPGEENPRIVIRGNNTWNGDNGPLILVDGIERPEFFNTMDVASVQSISVLKDASATAVFGSRGANGVIIVTTKRGKTGRAEIVAKVNTGAKVVSKLPGKKDSYDAIRVRNRAIENELAINPSSWDFIIPQQIVDKYRYPENAEEAERYPNIDWQEALFKEYAMSYNANLSISGGTDLTKYFASLDYQGEGDLMKDINNNRGYDPGYSYNRLNFRSNLDFKLTSTTKLQTNLSGSYGVRKSPWGGGNEYPFWIAAYGNAPDAFIPQYSDGVWGYHRPNVQGGLNSVRILAISGIQYTTRAQISTNFVLDQNLDFLLKGLNFKGTLALDNTFVEVDRGVNDLYNAVQEKWIDPETGQHLYENTFDNSTRFDFYDQGASWSPTGGTVANWMSHRRLYYQLQLNYATTVAEKHNFGAMGLLSRQQEATGSVVPHYREDWVFRGTYNYDGKYSFEYNGAYNGSERFGPDYRFAYFSSGGVGWMLSDETFMKSISFLDVFKLRASYGEVGDDNIQQGRFLFTDVWEYNGESQLGTVGVSGEYSPYTWYVLSELGNPSVHWETVYKYNAGVDFGFFKGLVSGSVDFFRDNRKDILIGADRAVPFYFGTTPPAANLGRMQTEGFEVTMSISHTLKNDVRLWADLNMTHAIDKISFRDDPELMVDYQKQAGYQLGQARTHISGDYYNTWDEVYASTPHDNNDLSKLPGNYNILDFNADGIVTAQDAAPFGFSGLPQNTYSTTVGFEWKGLSAFVQFYGVNNVSRQVVFNSLTGQLNRVYDEGTYWSKDNPDADSPMPRWLSIPSNYNSGSRYFFDGSYLRLKNAEIAYRFESAFVNKLGLSSLRVYLNGNNLFLWTKMPDDREANYAGNGWAAQGAYPTVKRFNLGLNLTF